MFFEASWSRKSIGDVEVVFHEGLYHLFHLVLPNHDFIAHAISDNALNWRRVDNALFAGDPGSWDDLMLWTMHVTPDPFQSGRWRMFYTGLSRRDQGRIQRLGMATSEDLFHWKKSDVKWQDLRGTHDPGLVKQARAKMSTTKATRVKSVFNPGSCFPLEADPMHYEASDDNERQLVSFRDPYYFRDLDQGWLLVSARVNEGPLVRRGCVALMKEVSPNQFRPLPPLHAPMLYDDVEVPNIFRIDGEYYLIGSIREDAKIRYWHTPHIDQPWRNYYDNVLMPRGNYAGRICFDDQGILLWNFYTDDLEERQVENLLPPPKRLRRSSNGQLQVTTFEGIEKRTLDEIDTQCLRSIKGDRRECYAQFDDGTLRLVSEAGFQGFVFSQEVNSFRLRYRLTMTGIGKCGILCRIDSQSHDGYYLSLDVLKGVAQLRSWGTGPPVPGEGMMRFKTLQEGFWHAGESRELQIQLIAFGSYHELCINGRVILSLADATFNSGMLGFYVETAELQIDELSVQRLEPPSQSDEHLTAG